MANYQFTPGQKTFIRSLASRTGLDSHVIAAWVYSEMNGGAAAGRQKAGNNNWLNIAYYDSGPGGITKSGVWRTPESAASATADFLKGKRFGPSGGIRRIIRFAGKSPQDQISAIANSGWASSGYGGGSTLRSVYGGLKGMDFGSSQVQRSGVARSRTGGMISPGVDNSSARSQLILDYARQRNRPGALLDLVTGLRANQDTPASYTQAPSVSRSGGSSAPSGGGPLPGVGRTVSDLKNRANAIDRKRLPYLWGGGHGGKVNPYKATPLDCSGAVSAVLGIDPRVSGQFTKWGKPGRGGKVTIYANGEHVFMEIDGHFFGTSRSNPGGGAGWIPRSAVSASYLKGFTARHVG